MKRVHLESPMTVSACGVGGHVTANQYGTYRGTVVQVTRSTDDVTCKRCLSIIRDYERRGYRFHTLDGWTRQPLDGPRHTCEHMTPERG